MTPYCEGCRQPGEPHIWTCVHKPDELAAAVLKIVHSSSRAVAKDRAVRELFDFWSYRCKKCGETKSEKGFAGYHGMAPPARRRRPGRPMLCDDCRRASARNRKKAHAVYWELPALRSKAMATSARTFITYMRYHLVPRPGVVYHDDHVTIDGVRHDPRKV